MCLGVFYIIVSSVELAMRLAYVCLCFFFSMDFDNQCMEWTTNLTTSAWNLSVQISVRGALESRNLREFEEHAILRAHGYKVYMTAFLRRNFC